MVVAKPGFHQRSDLVAPEGPALREAVQENDQWAFAFDRGTQPDAVCLDQLEIALLHDVLL